MDYKGNMDNKDNRNNKDIMENELCINHNANYRKLGLYIHIPFCAKKCDYCDFLSAPASKDTIDQYFDAMLTEIEQYEGNAEDYIVPSIFIGGGTPSVVEASYIKKVMDRVSRVFHIDRQCLEATIEINPGTVTRDKLQTYREVGINRLSFGLQSVDNKELKLLGRIHTYEQFEENYYLAREMGFKNINIDLMSALPGQTVATWEHTLNKVIGLNPEHISAYSLIIEEGTKFYERYRDNAPFSRDLPDEETDRMIYHRTKEILKNSGYHRYEISNYAKDAYECRHNSSYWTGTEYLGIGLGASSLLDSARFSNMHNIEQYIYECKQFEISQKNVISVKQDAKNRESRMTDFIGLRINVEQLTLRQKMEEFMFLGLRMCAGVSKIAFYERFGTAIDQVYQAPFSRLVSNNLLEIMGDTIRLTEYGIDISNYVLSEFLLD